MQNSTVQTFLRSYAALVFAFIYWPLIVVAIYSFNSNPLNIMIWDHFTLDWYRTVLGVLPGQDSEGALNPAQMGNTKQLLDALATSLIVAGCSTVVASVAGTAAAIALARYRFRLKWLVYGLLLIPIMIPDVVLGVGLLVSFVTMGMELSVLTIVISHCTFLTAYVFIVVQVRMAGLDPTLEEASADLGASEWMTIRKIVLPQLAPAILGGALLAFIISMDDLGIAYFVAGTGDTTIPVLILGMIRRGVRPEVNAIATLVMLASASIAWALLSLRVGGLIAERKG